MFRKSLAAKDLEKMDAHALNVANARVVAEGSVSATTQSVVSTLIGFIESFNVTDSVCSIVICGKVGNNMPISKELVLGLVLLAI
jgi:hypothetical protein